MPDMDLGSLDRRIVLQRATTARDAANEEIETFATLLSVAATATPISDGEKFRSGQVAGDIAYRFKVHYSATIATLNPKDRLTFDGRTFDINGVKEIGRRLGFEITATARAER